MTDFSNNMVNMLYLLIIGQSEHQTSVLHDVIPSLIDPTLCLCESHLYKCYVTLTSCVLTFTGFFKIEWLIAEGFKTFTMISRKYIHELLWWTSGSDKPCNQEVPVLLSIRFWINLSFLPVFCNRCYESIQYSQNETNHTVFSEILCFVSDIWFP